MKYKALETKRQFIKNKFVVGIDPAKERHQAAVLDPYGSQLAIFTFRVNFHGFHTRLWKKLQEVLPEAAFKELVFAIETSCNLWQNFAHYLHASGFPLVSPLTTYRSRSLINHDFSHTDPKDALLVASNTLHGYFDFYKTFSPEINALHELSMTYCKIRRSLLQQRARLRAYLEYVFPEFLQVITLDTETARFLLKDYFLPEHFLNLDTEAVASQMAKVSQNQYGIDSLHKLQQAAGQTIGIRKTGPEVIVGQLAIQTWLSAEAHFKTHREQIKGAIMQLVSNKPEFEIIKSLKGISDLLAALFIAETKDLAMFKHYKQIEKFAGLNLRIIASGKYVGKKRISRIGNSRLSWILYWMAEQTARTIPEIRIKYLKRQIKQPGYRMSLIACVPVLLKLIMTLVKEQRIYEDREDRIAEVRRLERIYDAQKNKNIRTRKKAEALAV